MAEFRDGCQWVSVTWLIQHYGFSRSWWAARRDDGTGPEFGKFGHRSVLYPLDEVESWARSHLAGSLSDPRYFSMVQGQASRNKKVKPPKEKKKIT